MKIQTKHRTNGTGPALDPHKTRARMAVVDDTQPSPATKGKRKAKAPAPVEMLTIQGVIVPKLPKREIEIWLLENADKFSHLDKISLEVCILNLRNNFDVSVRFVQLWKGIVKPPAPPEPKEPADDGKIKPARPDRRIENIKAGLATLGYSEFKFNEFSSLIETDARVLDDGACAGIRVHMRNTGFADMTAIEDYYFSIAKENAFNPVKQYLESLPPWDGTDHLAALLAHVTFENDPSIVYKDSTQNPTVKASYALHMRWMQACIARVYNPKAQNIMPVLDGYN